MNVLVLGSGAREHSICCSLANSNLISKLFCAPGNPGISEEAYCINLDIENNNSIIEFSLKNKIDLVIPGTETPLVNGIIDDLKKYGIKAFGPSKYTAQLEGSKKFTKDICTSANIPTANFEYFTNKNSALNYLDKIHYPIVVKADGLAAGKGVVIAKNVEEAKKAINNSFDGYFGEAGKKLLIEEFLEGPELSYFVLSDGKTSIPISSAQDHKKVGNGDTGLNTGGMGAFSPSPILTKKMENLINKRIIEPTLKELAKRNTPYQGVLYAGLIITKEGPKLIEFNVRFGDPECQVLLTRIKSNLLDIFLATCNQTLNNINIEFYDDFALTVVMAANGYPEKYTKGSEILGIKQAEKNKNIKVFQAGTTIKNNKLVSNGGRVLSITSKGKSIREARKLAYDAINHIVWKDGFYRNDIGLK